MNEEQSKPPAKPRYIIMGPPRDNVDEVCLEVETSNPSLAYWFWTIGFEVFENEAVEIYGSSPPTSEDNE